MTVRESRYWTDFGEIPGPTAIVRMVENNSTMATPKSWVNSQCCIFPENRGSLLVQTVEESISIDYAPLMMQALKLATKGRGWTRSNPLVGAVVLDRNGDVAAEGFHERIGGAHAEVVALKLAGLRASGGTLVVNLEPCCHTGRTGPCCDAIVAADISRVVIAHSDPDPRVAGKGIEILRAHGLDVILGVQSDEAEIINRHYILNKRLGRSFVTLKMAVSLDGFSADAENKSKWITGTGCRINAQRLRSWHDAIVVGATTARLDNPRLTVRDVPGPQPDRFVMQGTTEIRDSLTMFDGENKAMRVGLSQDHSDWVVPAGRNGYPDVTAFTERLENEGYSSLLVEGGSRLAGSFLTAGLVDRLVIYYGPMLLGTGLPAVHGWGASLVSALRYKDISVVALDGGMVWTGYPEDEEDVHRAG